MANKSLSQNEKHFSLVKLSPDNQTLTLEDNIFSQITFQTFSGYKINKISLNAFNQTANKLKEFVCSECSLDSEPNYDLICQSI